MTHFLNLLSLVRISIVECVLLGLLAGIVGVLAVVGKRVFFTEALTHATFPGAVIGVVFAGWFWVNILGTRASHREYSIAIFFGAAVGSAIMVFVMFLLSRIPIQSSQASAGIVLTLGFALGYFFMKWYAPLPISVDTFLTGSVVHVNTTDITMSAVCLVLALIFIALFGKKYTFYIFDPLGFKSSGMRSAGLQFTSFLLIGLATIATIPAVGTILPIALLAAPCATLVRSISNMRLLFLCSGILGVCISVGGLLIAVALNLSVGGTIGMLAGFVYLCGVAVRKLKSIFGQHEYKSEPIAKPQYS